MSLVLILLARLEPLSMIRLFVTADLAQDHALALDLGQSRYLTAVMRREVGDEVLVFNGRDGEWRGALEVVAKRGVVLRLTALERPQAFGPDLDLVVAVHAILQAGAALVPLDPLQPPARLAAIAHDALSGDGDGASTTVPPAWKTPIAPGELIGKLCAAGSATR